MTVRPTRLTLAAAIPALLLLRCSTSGPQCSPPAVASGNMCVIPCASLPTGCTPSDAGAGPRLVAPLSSSVVDTRSPAFAVEISSASSNSAVDVCSDRPCAIVVQSVPVSTSQFHLPTPLAIGTYFWRMRYTDIAANDETTPTWEFFVRPNADAEGGARRESPDLDGDGIADLPVAAQLGGMGYGTVFAYQGSHDWAPVAPTWTVAGEGYDRGPSVAATDVDGDGFDDVVSGTYLGPYVDVFFGSASGIGASHSQSISGAAGFGLSVAALGDVNADGFGDCAIRRGTLEADIYFGGPHGLAAGPSLTPSTATVGGVAGAGDVDGDGYADTLVVSPCDAVGCAPAAFIFRGSSAGPAATPSFELRPPSGFTAFADRVGPSGDVNGDGSTDVVIGGISIATSAVSLFAYYGGAGTFRSTPSTVAVPEVGRAAEVAVSGVGDLNADGFDDVVVLVPMPGVMAVFLGQPTGISSPVAMTYSYPGGTIFDAWIEGSGDFDADGYDDVVLGVEAAGGEAYGQSFLVFRGAASIDWTTPSATLRPGG